MEAMVLTRKSNPALPKASFNVEISTLFDSFSFPVCVGWRERGAGAGVEAAAAVEVVAVKVAVAGVAVWYCA